MRSITRMTVAVFLAFIYVWGTNWYEPNVNVLTCTGDGCWHEIGHKMDDDLGFPSRSPQFGLAVQQYLLVEMKRAKPDVLAEAMFSLPGLFSYDAKHPHPNYELYATIYALAEGDIARIPYVFRRFYSDSEMYPILHECLTQPDTNMCGFSFSWIDPPTIELPPLSVLGMVPY